MQSYLPATDADERLSPFLAAESAHKYGNIQVIPAQTGQDHEVCINTRDCITYMI
jgi:hypothetical protein